MKFYTWVRSWFGRKPVTVRKVVRLNQFTTATIESTDMNAIVADGILDTLAGQFEPPDPLPPGPGACDCGVPSVRSNRTMVEMECGARYWRRGGEWEKDMPCREDRKVGTLDMSPEAIEGWVHTPAGGIVRAQFQSTLGSWTKGDMTIHLSAEYWWSSGSHCGGEDMLEQAMRRASWWGRRCQTCGWWADVETEHCGLGRCTHACTDSGPECSCDHWKAKPTDARGKS